MKINAYAAMEKGSVLKPWTREVHGPGPQEIIAEVKACGVCHSDLSMMENEWGASRYPLVPGHEVVAEVLEVGSEVEHLTKGQRVGVGWWLRSCLHCDECLSGRENLCAEGEALIGAGYGGFADLIVADSRFCYVLPDGISNISAGPLMCGGITVYGGLRAAGMGSGQHIGIVGIGGLGHMAVQFAAKLGNRVTCFTSSQDKAEEAASFGAHDAVVYDRKEMKFNLKKPCDIILYTAPVADDLDPWANLLATDGTLCIVGGIPTQVRVSVFNLLAKRRRVMGSPTDGRFGHREMLRVADTYGVEPLTEVFPISEHATALGKVADNSIRYRGVLTN